MRPPARLLPLAIALLLLPAACARPDLTSMIHEGQDERARARIASGAPIPATDPLHLTPLAIAAWHGKLDLAGAILDRGIDPNAVSGPDAWTPLHAALANTAQWNTEMVELLLARGADPGAPDANGRTPLHAACARTAADDEGERAALAIVVALLAAGADPAARDRDGLRPIHLAAAAGPPLARLEALLAAGADPFVASYEGLTALDFAARRDDGAAVPLLLDAGLRPHPPVDRPAAADGSLRGNALPEISARSYEAYAGWQRARGDEAGARESLQAARVQYVAAIAEYERVVGVYTTELSDAKRENVGRAVGSAVGSAVGIGLMVATGIGFVTLPRLSDEPEHHERTIELYTGRLTSCRERLAAIDATLGDAAVATVEDAPAPY